MPNNPRQHYKRKLGYVLADIHNALVLLAEVAVAYSEAHPEITEGLETVAMGLMAAEQCIRDIDSTI